MKSKILRRLSVIVSVGVILAMAPASLYAHHSAAGLFSPDQETTVNGTVTKWFYVNPHAGIAMEVKNAAGVPEEWRVELGSIQMLNRIGWTRNILKPGDQITVTGNPYFKGKNIFGRFVTVNGKKYEVHPSVEKTNKTDPGSFAGREDFNVGDDDKPAATSSPKRK